jgi:selenoprotein W-related protein
MKKYQITVEFCMQWNYAPRAASFAEKLIIHFRHDIEKFDLIPSSGGVFEVTVNGEKIYSKMDTGVFPEIEEMIKKVETM